MSDQESPLFRHNTNHPNLPDYCTLMGCTNHKLRPHHHHFTHGHLITYVCQCDYFEGSLAALTEREHTLHTNPITCQHNVLTARVTEQLEFLVECVSCGTDLTDFEKRVGKNYEYSIDSNVWVHEPTSRKKKS